MEDFQIPSSLVAPQAPKSYFRTFENTIEWSTFVLSIVFVCDLTGCHEETGLRFGWQWQLGAVAITAAWVNLVSNVRKFPFLGIYVVMITDVLMTFMKVAVIVILLVEGFALGFYCLLAEQVSLQCRFRNAARSHPGLKMLQDHDF